MAQINITACKYCSNHEALLAVAKWIEENKSSGYKRIRNVTIDSGKIINVFEKLRDDELSSCNADFIVTGRLPEQEK